MAIDHETYAHGPIEWPERDRAQGAQIYNDLVTENARLKEELREFTELKEYAKSLGQETYLELHAKNERLRKGIQDYLNGDFEPRLKKLDKCKHGFYGYEECGRCVDEYFQRLLGGPSGNG